MISNAQGNFGNEKTIVPLVPNRQGAPPEVGNAGELCTIPPAIFRLLGEPLIIPGENADSYWELFKRLAGELKPSGVVCWLWLKDYHDIVWEIWRLRRLRIAMVKITRRQIAEKRILARLPKDFDEGPRLVKEYLEGGASATAELAKHIPEGVDLQEVTASAFDNHIDLVEQTERMIESAERRRTLLLREIDEWTARRAWEATQPLEVASQ